MSYLHCPYCEIKEDTKVKSHYEALYPMEGKCPDCGAYLDIGQTKINVNSYADIYKGVIATIEDVVNQINNLMDYLDVDTEVDGETPRVKLNTSKIIRNIFIPYYGSTSVCNFKNAIGVDSDEIEFEIKAERYEW